MPVQKKIIVCAVLFVGFITITAGVLYTASESKKTPISEPVITLPPPSSSESSDVTDTESVGTTTATAASPEASGSVSPQTSVPSLMQPTPNPYPTPMTPATPISNTLSVMAWIYPSAPGCNAGNEYRDGRSIDILKPEFFTVNDGTLQLFDNSNAECNGFSPAFVADVKAHSREQFVTVSSASADAMNTFLASALSSDEAITTLVTFVVTNNLTGIELDFEDFGGWSASSYSSYKEFVKRLGNALHAAEKKLMLDGPAIADATEQGWFAWRYEDFVTLPVDTIVVMLYDYQFDHGAGEPVAPLDWMKKVITWTSARYPTQKLSIGIPSYGYEAVIGKRPYIRTYDQLKNKPGFNTATRDTRSGEMTWRSGNTVYFYQDKESLRQKIAVVESAGITSISIWHLGGNQWY